MIIASPPCLPTVNGFDSRLSLLSSPTFVIGDPGFCPHVSSQMEGRKRKILDPRSGRG